MSSGTGPPASPAGPGAASLRGRSSTDRDQVSYGVPAPQNGSAARYMTSGPCCSVRMRWRSRWKRAPSARSAGSAAASGNRSLDSSVVSTLATRFCCAPTAQARTKGSARATQTWRCCAANRCSPKRSVGRNSSTGSTGRLETPEEAYADPSDASEPPKAMVSRSTAASTRLSRPYQRSTQPAKRRYQGGCAARPRTKEASESSTTGSRYSRVRPDESGRETIHRSRTTPAQASSMRRARSAWASTRAASIPSDGAASRSSWTYSSSITASR